MLGIVLALFAAVLDLVAVALGWHEIRVLTKPAPALILAVVAWRGGSTPCRLLAGGLALAAVGDELLLGSGDTWFLAGMLAFAAMQIIYILAFSAASGRSYVAGKPVRAIAGAAYAALFIVAQRLVVSAAGALRIPVMVYSILLTLMSGLATSLTFTWPFRYAWPVALGGIVFLASDLTLAAARFVPGFPLQQKPTELVVMGTYFLAQILITLGMTNAAKQNAEHDQTLAQESPGHV